MDNPDKTDSLSTKDILVLLAAPGLGRKTVSLLLHNAQRSQVRYSDLITLIAEVKRQNSRIRVPSETELREAESRVLNSLEMSEQLGIKIIGWDSSEYPSCLRKIDDPPLVLYTKGNITCLSEPSVAIVGTREPSAYGVEIAFRISTTFSEAGFTIVSGLALGCDTAAHRGCISVNGKTVAVLAHGLDSVYPAKNRTLAEEILDRSGCWVSEYPPGTKSRNNYFIERDRIQSGLSEVVVVIETGLKGGTMHTVGFCKKQRRILACLEHPDKYRHLDSTKGNQKLLTDGDALPLGTKEDVEDLIQRISLRTNEPESEDQHPATPQQPLF